MQAAPVAENPPTSAGDAADAGPRVGKVPGRRAGQPTPVFLPGESHGQESLTGYSPQGHKDSDMTKQDLNQSSSNCKYR